MKKSNGGFVLMETLIVSAFIIGTLVYLFVQFSNIKRSYDISFQTDTITGLYQADQLASYWTQIDQTSITSALESNGYVELQDCNLATSHRTYCENLIQLANAKTVLLVQDDLTELKKKLQTNNPFEEELYQYIQRLKTSNTTSKRLIVQFNNHTVASILFGGDL